MASSSSKRRRTGGASASTSRPTNQFDNVRFTSAENERWFEERKHKGFIKEKNVAPNVEAYFHLNDLLARIGWETVLHLPEVIYPELVKEFYADVEENDKFSGNFIQSTVRGTAMEITRGVIAAAVGCRNDGPDVNMKKSLITPAGWSTKEAANRYRVNTEPIRKRDDQRYFADKLQPVEHLLVHVFGCNVIPRKSGRNEVRTSDLFFLDMIFHGTEAERGYIPLPSIYISYMRNVARSQSGTTCFGLPRLLTALFRHFDVDLTGQEAAALTATDIFSCRLLLHIGMTKKLVTTIERGQSSQVEAAKRAAESSEEGISEEESSDEERAAGAGPSSSRQAPAPRVSSVGVSQFDWGRMGAALTHLETRLMGRMDAMEARLLERLDHQDKQLRYLRGVMPTSSPHPAPPTSSPHPAHITSPPLPVDTTPPSEAADQ